MDIKYPLVSVLISAYNHEMYVQETIKSLISQAYQNIELIVFDDGSSDSTWKKIQELEDDCKKRFVNTYFVTKANEGTCVTINKMLDISAGKYVYMIASDDKAKPEAIQKEVYFLEKNPEYALVVGNNEFIDSSGNLCYWGKNKNIVYDREKAKYKTFGEYLQKVKRISFTSKNFGLYETLYWGNYIPNGYLIRKTILNEIGPFTKEAPLEDWYMMLQISKYSKMKYLNEVLFSYRWHDKNTIKQKEKIDNYVRRTREYEKKILNKVSYEDILPSARKIKYIISLKEKKYHLLAYYFCMLWSFLKIKRIRQTVYVCWKKVMCMLINNE